MDVKYGFFFEQSENDREKYLIEHEESPSHTKKLHSRSLSKMKKIAHP